MFSEWGNKTWLRLRAIWKRPQLDRDLEDEVAFHLAMREEKNRLAGVDPQESWIHRGCGSDARSWCRREHRHL